MKLNRLITTLSTSFAALALMVSPMNADDAANLDKQVKALDKGTAAGKEIKPALDDVSKKTGVPTKKLEKQHRETGMGAGSLFIANTLAKETGKSFDEIVAAHENGRGWGKVAKDNGVKLGPLVSEAKKLEKQNRARQGKKGKQEKNGNKSKDKRDKPEDRENANDQNKGKDKGSNSSSKAKSKNK